MATALIGFWQRVNWSFVKDFLFNTIADAWWATIWVGGSFSVVYLAYQLEPAIFEGIQMDFIEEWGRNTQVMDHLVIGILPGLIGSIDSFRRKEKDDV